MTSWPHSPSHVVDHPGTYILTAATLRKTPVFNTPDKLKLLEQILLETYEQLGWQVQAWAVFANHYHLVGLSPDEGLGLTDLTQRVHRASAREVNRIDGAPGRAVWYRCWDTRISFERSYLARLAYVHTNPVRHGIVANAEDYQWCSAHWFRSRASAPFYQTVMSFKTDKVNVNDDF